MDDLIISKRKFKNSLRPILSLLQSKRMEVSNAKWKELVQDVKSRIQKNPTEFLESPQTSDPRCAEFIESIFYEFENEMSMRN